MKSVTYTSAQCQKNLLGYMLNSIAIRTLVCLLVPPSRLLYYINCSERLDVVQRPKGGSLEGISTV